MAPRSARPRAAAALAALAWAGCGYGFTAGTARLPKGADSVFVRPLENRTTDAEAGALVAAALRQELARRGAEGGPAAPARIEGAVERSTNVPSSPGSVTWRLALDVEARLLVGEAVVAEQRVHREEDYLGEVDALASEGRRRVALRRAAEAAAREIVEHFESP